MEGAMRWGNFVIVRNLSLSGGWCLEDEAKVEIRVKGSKGSREQRNKEAPALP